jgi:hypothetical protein
MGCVVIWFGKTLHQARLPLVRFRAHTLPMLYGKLEMEKLYGPDVVTMSKSSYIPGGTTTPQVRLTMK